MTVGASLPNPLHFKSVLINVMNTRDIPSAHCHSSANVFFRARNTDTLLRGQ